jgi:hypothetical protein
MGVLAVVLLCTGLAVSAITRVLLATAAGQPLGLVSLLRLTPRRSLVSLTLTYALTGFLAHAGLLLLVLPGLVLGGLFAASLPAVLVEKRAAFPAMGRSTRLMRQDLLRAMAVYSLGLLVSEFAPVGVVLVLQMAAGESPFSPLLAILLNGLTLPAALALGVTLYLAARVQQGTAPEALRAEVAQAAARP